MSTSTSERAFATSAGGAQGATPVEAFLDLLLTVGYLDGEVDLREATFLGRYLDSVVAQLGSGGSAAEQESARAAWRAYFADLYRRLDAEIAGLARIVPADDPAGRLRGRALSRFRSLERQDQAAAVELLLGFIHVHRTPAPAARDLYAELAACATATAVAPAARPLHMRAVGPGPAPARTAPLLVGPPAQRDLVALSHALLDPIEQPYSSHPVERKAQIEWDCQLVQRALEVWRRQRSQGSGRLAGVTDPCQIPPGADFLDGHVYAMRPDRPVELVVLGDLHGCYSNFKAALLQSNFIARAWAHQREPDRFPAVKLVLLGDYIDRGRFSFDGVLRAALYLFVTMPEQVILLRGNHEYLLRAGDRIFSGVHPAEALASITGHVSTETLDQYRVLFDQMPTSLICDRTLFVHGGIPRDDTFAERYRDLSSLNDPELRLQMMWSDPVQAQHVPVERQRANPRFSFGHAQFRAFMERTGMSTMIRGHEVVKDGFHVSYDLGESKLLNLFSAGGHDNDDLPADSSYRAVNPMALSVSYGHGAPAATPWPLRYRPFNYPPQNGLYRDRWTLDFQYA